MFGVFGRNLMAKLVLFMGVILVLAIGIFAYVSINTQEQQLMNNTVNEALRLSDIVKKTTQYSMLQNHREGVQRIIDTVGSEESIEKVRVFNKMGKIMVSSDKSEMVRVFTSLITGYITLISLRLFFSKQSWSFTKSNSPGASPLMNTSMRKCR